MSATLVRGLIRERARRIRGIPVHYARVYLTRTGWVYEIDSGTRRRSRRRAA